MKKVIEIKKNITTLGRLSTALNNDDFLFLLKTLEDLLYIAILEAQAFHADLEGQGAYRVAVLNIKSHAVTKIEFSQDALDSDPKQRQLANLATIGAIVKDGASLVLATNSYKSGDSANLLVSIQIKDFGCRSQLGHDAIQAYVSEAEDANESIFWEIMPDEILMYQQYLLPIT